MTDYQTPGATISTDGVAYCVWAPDVKAAQVSIHPSDGSPKRDLAMTRQRGGYWHGKDPDGAAGDAYAYVIDGKGPFPDPASRAQQSDIHGRSLVIDPAWPWKDSGWKRPPFRDLVIYELHIGTFTPKGTFRSTMGRLPHLKALGVTAIEIMPVGDFPGSRNWGYDGVYLYAPAHCYGTPDDFRALVERAHALGIAVLLDVVYNHFGPDGNYLGAFSRHYFTKRHHTPWGSAFNFDGRRSGPVRDFFLRNPAYWMDEFHIDGFRLDATHEIKDDSTPHILAEMTESIHSRGGYAIAEDARNDNRMITPYARGGMGFDAVWADDFHHTVRVGQTNEEHSYFSDFDGSLKEVVTALQNGWLYSGKKSKFSGTPRGSSARRIPPTGFVHCISNHDQTGNRAKGERLHHLISPAAYRALSMLLCLSPYTPMLWMGQEWGAHSPFLFFTDHETELGHKVTEGRRREFASFPEFADPKNRDAIPDPQETSTYEKSKLNVKKADTALLALYQECLHLRNENAAFRPVSRDTWRAEETDWGVGMLLFENGSEAWLLLFDLKGRHHGPVPEGKGWKLMLSSEDAKFGGAGEALFENGKVRFDVPAGLLFHRAAC